MPHLYQTLSLPSHIHASMILSLPRTELADHVASAVISTLDELCPAWATAEEGERDRLTTSMFNTARYLSKDDLLTGEELVRDIVSTSVDLLEREGGGVMGTLEGARTATDIKAHCLQMALGTQDP